MIISLDYDGTYTAAPQLWNAFLDAAARRKNVQVYVVTMRYDDPAERIPDELALMVDNVIYTGRKAKKPFCEELGIKIDIWIDDNPHFVVEDARPMYAKGQTEEAIVLEDGE